MTNAETVHIHQPVIVHRITDADFVNHIVNHPSVRPWVCGQVEGPLDLSPLMENPANIVLASKYGAMVCVQCQPGLYDLHTNVLPEGRGPWALEFAQACLYWIFTKTDAAEVVLKVPKGNLAALTMVRLVSGQYEATRNNIWYIKNRMVPVRVFMLNISQWVRTAPGLVERGRLIDAKMRRAFNQAGYKSQRNDNDDELLRHVGAAMGMVLDGNHWKGAVIYNRWASIAGFAQARILSEKPLTLDMGGSLLIVRNGDFWVVPCQSSSH